MNEKNIHDRGKKLKIGLGDLLCQGRELVLPREPVSLYRYVEHLVEVSVKRKYDLKNIVEIGPGADTIFRYLKPDEYASGTLIDYNQDILEYNSKHLSGHSLELLNIDIMKEDQVKAIDRKWDYVVADGVIEHLSDDRMFVRSIYGLLNEGGAVFCSTVLQKWLYNKWDHAAGHYRRYNVNELRSLFADFRDVRIIQSSLLQELVRPLFYNRVRHMFGNTIEENNMLISKEFLSYGIPPYAGIFWLLRYTMPIYLFVDWVINALGGVCFVIARK